MAHSSKSGASIGGKRDVGRSLGERWKSAPSSETTHADPESKDAQVRRWQKKAENTPRKKSGK
jgi:hypothetical protein